MLAFSFLFSNEAELIVKMSLYRMRNCPEPEVHCVSWKRSDFCANVFPQELRTLLQQTE